MLATILADNARSALINHAEAFRTALIAVGSRSIVIAEGAIDGTVDVDGREDLVDALARHLEAEGALVMESACLFESDRAATAFDVLAQLLACLQGHSAPTWTGVDSAAQALSTLVAAVSQQTCAIAVIISSVDQLPPRERAWILDKVVPALRDAGDVSVILTCAPGALDAADESFTVSTLKLGREHVAEHLARWVQWDVAADMAETSLTYAEYKRFIMTRHLNFEGRQS